MPAKPPLGTVWKHRGKWAARYTRNQQTHTPGQTFSTEKAAVAWLRAEQVLIDKEKWTPPAHRRAESEAKEARAALTLGSFARDWVEARRVKGGALLAEKTRREYLRYLDGPLADLAAMPLQAITTETVDAWWLAHEHHKTYRRSAYAFMKTVLDNAASPRRAQRLIDVNPCMVDDAMSRPNEEGKIARSKLVTDLTPNHIARLRDAYTIGCYRLLVSLTAYCGLRPAESLALHSDNIDRARGADGVPAYTLHIIQAVTDRGQALRQPKAGSYRRIPVPPHVADEIDHQLMRYAMNGLLFPPASGATPYTTDGQIKGTAPTSKGGATGWYAARLAIEMPTLRLYDLRHWARNQFRKVGMDPDAAEMMLGHKLPGIKDVYNHFDPEEGRAAMLRLSQLAGWTSPIQPDAPSEVPTDALRLAIEYMDDDTLTAYLDDLSPVDRESALRLVPAPRRRRLSAASRPALEIVK